MSLTRVVPQNPFLLFAKNFLQHPRMLGSVVPSSRFLIQRLADRIDWRTARVVVEYGPGVGNVSQQLLSKLNANGRLVLVEMNEEFVFLLRQRLRDPRVKVVHGSAANIREILHRLGIAKADYIVSGIPYSTIPAGLRRRILRESQAMTSASGEVIVFQFMRTIERELRACFQRVEVEFEARNFPPARVWYCR